MEKECENALIKLVIKCGVKEMLLTKRQKSILQNLLHSNGLSIKDLEQRVGTSRRTLYREFNQIRPSLTKQGIGIINEKKLIHLTGDKVAIDKLAEELNESVSQNVMTVSERKNALACILLLDDEAEKIFTLADKLQVSEATVQSDLNEIAESFKNYDIRLIRKKGVGVWVETDEEKRRRFLGGILLTEINDYAFFKYLDSGEVTSTNFFLNLIDKELLILCRDAFDKSISGKIEIETDHQLIELICLFAISITRLLDKHPIKKANPVDGSLKYQAYVYQFFALIKEKISVDLSMGDAIFLANEVQNYDTPPLPAYDDDSALSVSVRINQFVEDVSENFKWDFQRNPKFLNRLKNHIMGLLQHKVERLPNVHIATLTQLIDSFPNLYKAVAKSWDEDFPDEHLNNAELQLLLLYFANEYNNSNYRRNISALVICDNGIGTSAILASRLRNELPQIKDIKLAKASELSKIDLENYDIILSTLKLPGFPREYQLVSPLLLKDEINSIKNYLKDYLKKFPDINKGRIDNNSKITYPTRKLSDLSTSFLFCNELVQGITQQKINNYGLGIEEVIKKMIDDVDSSIVKDKEYVCQKLIDRLKLAPLGIPDGHTALIHSSNSGVKRCYFGLFDLNEPEEILAMDHLPIKATRLLLMLAPSNLSEAEQDVVSMLSGMIVLSDANLKMFTSGSKKQIQDMISEQFLRKVSDQLAKK